MSAQSQTNPCEQTVQACRVEAYTMELSLQWIKGAHIHFDAPPRER